MAGDLEAARLAAAEAGVGALTLALLALSSGKPELALTQAELILAASPREPEAAIVGLVAASLLGDIERFRALLARVKGSRLPDVAVAPLRVDLIRWWVDGDAASTWAAALRAAQPARQTPAAPDKAR
jgi:hypothetical protein